MCDSHKPFSEHPPENASGKPKPAVERPDAIAAPLVGALSADLYRTFMEQSIDGIVIMDMETAGVIDANTAFAEMLGYTVEEVCRMKVWDWDAHWSQKELEQRFADNDWSERRFETRHRRRDGRILDVTISSTQIQWQGKPVSFCVVRDISEAKHQQDNLRQELARWQLLREHSYDGIVIFDPSNHSVLEVNPAFAHMLGYEPGEMIGMHPWDWDARFSRSEIESMADSHPPDEERFLETCMRRKDGDFREVEINGTPMASFINICVCRDVTARNQAERLLMAREQEFRSLTENFPDAIVRYDRQLCRLYVNPAFERLVGKNKTALLGRPLENSPSFDLSAYRAALEATLESGQPRELEFNPSPSENPARWAHARFQPEFGKDGVEVQSVLVVVRDISEMVEQRELARHLAFTDTLTGLPNRALFEKRFRDAADPVQAADKPFALLILDIDHFKDINDTLGHQTGDELLRQVTMRLPRCIRECDTIARLGGDEFAILMTGIQAVGDATEGAARILDTLRRPFHIDSQEIFVSGSIGIACHPWDSNDLNELFTFADTALYSAKRQGRNNFQCYSPALSRHAADRMSLLSALRHACRNEELQLHFQPKVLLESGQVVGAEALVRWHHPERGMLMPDRFITLAEESGAIIGIGRWILANACRAAVRFNREGAASFKIAVNLSSRQFIQHDLAGEVKGILEETGCRGEWLEFEITESLMIEDNREIRATFEAFRDLGISIAIDDFGTGYSALNYLRRFPMNVLKIDRSFINGIEADPQKAGLVMAFISVGTTLGMEIVAEGVETAAQSAVLQQLGCALGQGYLFGRPQSLEDLMGLLQAR